MVTISASLLPVRRGAPGHLVLINHEVRGAFRSAKKKKKQLKIFVMPMFTGERTLIHLNI
jgi:hypothetical protein